MPVAQIGAEDENAGSAALARHRVGQDRCILACAERMLQEAKQLIARHHNGEAIEMTANFRSREATIDHVTRPFGTFSMAPTSLASFRSPQPARLRF